MRKVFIKYNPYKVKTEIRGITEGGEKPLKELGDLFAKSKGSRLQDWVEELPGLLVDEYRDRDFEISFHGTLSDYEDLKRELDEAKNINVTWGEVNTSAIETSDKEARIGEVFKKIKKGPFDELRNERIEKAFELVKSRDFEVCVVATTSAGKSTLINAMLGQKLLPSKKKANTAIISRIKDDKAVKGKKKFRMDVLDEKNKPQKSPSIATLDILSEFNACPIKYRCGKKTPKCPESPLKPHECPHMDPKIPSIDTVSLYGNIPFVSSDDMPLVLIDTPGPDYLQDPRHGKALEKLLDKPLVLVLYIMTGGKFGTDDDYALLRSVSRSMKAQGKLSKDRFIFVVNKLDDFDEGKGDTKETLKNVGKYLKIHGVANPNLFLAAAKPALNIRRIMNGAKVDDVTVEETKETVRKLNRYAELHLETFTTLPASIRGKIDSRLKAAQSEYRGPDNENKDEALIHTGVESIEEAIKQYLQKYAKPAKIKALVDTFMGEIYTLRLFQELIGTIKLDENECAKIDKKIARIEKKIGNAKEAKKFKKEVNDSVVKVNDDSRKEVEGIQQKFQERITERIEDIRKKGNIIKDEAEVEVESLEKFRKELIPEFEVKLEEVIERIRTKMEETSNALLEGYIEKLATLIEDIDPENLTGVSIESLKLMAVSVTGFSFSELIKKEKVPDGQEKVQTRGWFESIFFWPKFEWKTKFKTKESVSGDELADTFSTQSEDAVKGNVNNVKNYALDQSNRIADDFNLKFKVLNKTLKKILDERKSFTINKEEVKKRVGESKRKLEWLEQIKAEVESILEI